MADYRIVERQERSLVSLSSVIETFTAEAVVTHPKQDYEPELARLATAWFGSKVRCITLDVAMSAESGRLLARGTYVPDPLPSRSRVDSVARWLGLVRFPGQPSTTPQVLH